MRNLLLGSLIGLVVGAAAALIYERYLGMGPELAQTQADLASANANLAKTAQDSQRLQSETDAISAQLNQVTSHNAELKYEVAELKKTSGNATSPTSNPGQEAYITQQLFLLKSRLNLTPEQEAALKAAMEAVTQAISNHTGITKTVDQTLNDILSPEQKTAWQQMKDDSKKTVADNMATIEMNQAATLLQLSEAQKDQVYSALYQVDLDQQNEDATHASFHSPSELASYMDARAQAKEDALAKILTPDQLATYHQQAQSELQAQKAAMHVSQSPGSGASMSGAASQ
jgi:chromosome segregation ATPase